MASEPSIAPKTGATGNPRGSARVAVELEGLVCSFPGHDGHAGPFTAVRNLNLRVNDGEFVAVVGPTGCGKSTILNVAAGLLRPTAGAVRIFGEPLAGLNRRAGY